MFNYMAEIADEEKYQNVRISLTNILSCLFNTYLQSNESGGSARKSIAFLPTLPGLSLPVSIEAVNILCQFYSDSPLIEVPELM
jgi:hypothetical protein